MIPHTALAVDAPGAGICPPPKISWPPGPAEPASPYLAYPPLPTSRSSGQTVYVWAARLDLSSAELQSAVETLSPAELDRADRFRFDRHRNRFIAGRAMLRGVLGRHLRTASQKLEFAYGLLGKPELAGSFAGSGFHFNLAHSEDLAVIALTAAGPIGVDVEWVRPLEDFNDLVSRFFSPREKAAFRSLAEHEKPRAFFNLWTGKEAWLKATGEGIAHYLNRVEVSFLPGEPLRLLSIPAALPQSALSWSLHEVAPAPGFGAAIAVAAGQPRFACWRWDFSAPAAGSPLWRAV
jgi:4'-phosphopantetheinyl transferase